MLRGRTPEVGGLDQCRVSEVGNYEAVEPPILQVVALKLPTVFVSRVLCRGDVVRTIANGSF